MSAFQSVNMPSTDTNAKLKIDLPDQTGSLWATLALLQMNEMVPEDAVSEALEFRDAIGDLLFSFSDAKAFLSLDSDACKHLKDQLDVLESRAKRYYDYDYEWDPVSVLFTTADYVPPPQTDQAQFAYLLEILVQFHAKLAYKIDEHLINAHDTHYMTLAIGELLHQITKPVWLWLFPGMTDHLQLSTWRGNVSQLVTENSINDLIGRATEQMHLQIMTIVVEQKALKTHGDFDPKQEVGAAFAKLLEVPLQKQLDVGLTKLIQVMRMSFTQFDEESAADDVQDFYYSLAELFTYSSKMIDEATFGGTDECWADDLVDYEPLPEDEVPDHIRNHEFEHYEDNDWFVREYELMEVQDVLRGSESATLGDVSVVVVVDSDTECGICKGIGEDTETAGIKCAIKVPLVLLRLPERPIRGRA